MKQEIRTKLCLLLFAFCLIPCSLRAQSVVCAGGPPYYCARTDRVPQPFVQTYKTNVDGTWIDSGPQIGVPFVTEFGERETRLTDGLSDPWNAGNAWSGPSDWWGNICSVYDSSINGYYCALQEASTQHMFLFAINRDTMQSTNVCATAWTQCEMPYGYTGYWSSVTPGLMYYTNATQILEYCYDASCPTAVVPLESNPQLVYDFSASCPGYSTYSSGLGYGSPQTDATDTWFGVDHAHAMDTVWNRVTGKCYWYNTRYQLVGGTDNATPIPSGMALGSPPTSFTLGTGSGSIPAGTYYVALSRDTDAAGTLGTAGSYTETTPTAAQSQLVAANGSITMSNIVIPSDEYIAMGLGVACNVYMGTTASNMTEQLADQSCSGTLTVSSYSTSGQSPLTVSTGGYLTHDGWMSLGGTWYWNSSDAEGDFSPAWNIVNSSGVAQNTVVMATEAGHVSAGDGGIFFVYDSPSTGGISGHYDFGSASFSSLPDFIHLLSAPPLNVSSAYTCNVDDTHPTWNADDPNDQTPAIVASIVDQSTSISGNALMATPCAFDHEIFGVSPILGGNATTYRFAHNNSTTWANSISSPQSNYSASSLPSETRDGKLMIYTSDWHWTLGTWVNPGDPSVGDGYFCSLSCAWSPSTAYAPSIWIIDSNGNAEFDGAGGTSGSGSHPAWPTTSGGTVTDGSITWTNYPGCNTAEDLAGSSQSTTNGACRTDVFAVELH